MRHSNFCFCDPDHISAFCYPRAFGPWGIIIAKIFIVSCNLPHHPWPTPRWRCSRRLKRILTSQCRPSDFSQQLFTVKLEPFSVGATPPQINSCPKERRFRCWQPYLFLSDRNKWHTSDKTVGIFVLERGVQKFQLGIIRSRILLNNFEWCYRLLSLFKHEKTCFFFFFFSTSNLPYVAY